MMTHAGLSRLSGFFPIPKCFPLFPIQINYPYRMAPRKLITNYIVPNNYIYLPLKTSKNLLISNLWSE